MISLTSLSDEDAITAWIIGIGLVMLIISILFAKYADLEATLRGPGGDDSDGDD